MKGRSLRHWPPLAVMVPLLLVCPAVAQSAGGAAAQGPLAPAPAPIQSGIVVETVAKNSAAEKAGLRMGDALLRWSRGDTRGALETPFELSQAETEQAPLGTVLLEGLRGAEKQVWSLGPGEWGLTARPNFTGTFLALYQEGQELATAGKVIEGTERWRKLAAQLPNSSASWLSVWLFSHSADGLVTARQWKEADDAYQLAVQQAQKSGPMISAQLLQAWAKSYARRRDWANAEKYFQQSITEGRKLGGGELGVASSLGGLGVINAQRGNLNKAEEYFRQALDIRQKVAPTSLAVAASLNLLGSVATDRGNLAKAEEYHRQALEIQQKLAPDSLAVATSSNGLGVVAAQRGDLAKAEEYFRQAVNIIQKLVPDSIEVASELNNLGNVAADRGELAKAEEYYLQALEIRKKLAPGSLEVAASLNNLGSLASDRGELTKAEEYYRQALEIKQKLAPGSLEVAAGLANLGSVAWKKGSPTAEEYYLQALEIRNKLAPESLDVAGNLNNLGLVAADHDDLAKAEEYYLHAFKIEQKLAPNSPVVATVLDNVGSVCRKRGDLTRAEEYYRQALVIRQKLSPESLSVAGSFNNLGIIASFRGELVKAEENYRKSLVIRQKLAPGSLEVAGSFNNLGNVALDRGDLDKAEEYFLQALAIKQKLAPESANLAGTLNNLGSIALARSELTKAEEYFRRAMDIQGKFSPGGLDVAVDLNNLGNVALERGELAKAAEYYRQGLDLKQKLAPESLDMADALQNLGNWARKSGDLGKAEQYHRQALAIRAKLAPGSKLHAESLAEVASILRENQQTEQASQLYAQAINALEEQTARLGGSEEIRSGFRSRHSAIYREYIDLLLAQKQDELAFQVLERSRAQSLIAMLNAARIDVHNGVDAALLARKRSLSADLQAKSNRRIHLLTGSHSQEQIATVEKEIAKLREQLQETQEQIRAASPGYAALTHPLALSTKELQLLLDPETVLLEYFLSEKRSHVFVLTSESLGVYELAKGVEIETVARRVHDLLTARVRKVKAETEQERMRRRRKESAEYPRAVLDLSRKVLGPVPMPPGKKHMLIVADGALHYIPFAVLPSPPSWNAKKHTTLPGPPPLVASYDIVGLPSAQTLALLRQQVSGRPQAPKAVAVLADPVFDARDVRIKVAGTGHVQKGGASSGPENNLPKDQRISSSDFRSAERLTRSLGDLGRSSDGQLHLPRLSFSRQEAKAIVTTVPAGQALEALDFKASRQTATSPELAQYRIVHFATHGVLDSVHPELSGLVLSMVDERGERQNGYMDLEDIYNLNLPVDLVVLSACETGLGKEVHGEGLVGLTRGFMYAGASRVVASLWEVDDMAAGELMGRFYQAMEKQGMRPAEALRYAQVQMSKQARWNSPYYWAAFQIQGEWR